MKLQTKDIYRFSPSSKIALTLTSIFAFAGFTWPFFAADKVALISRNIFSGSPYRSHFSYYWHS